MAVSNTSAFNCRAVTGGTPFSEHSDGWAIDVNPVHRPGVRRRQLALGRLLKRPDRRPALLLHQPVTRRLAIGVLAVALLAACGGDDRAATGGDTTRRPTTSRPPTTTTTAPPATTTTTTAPPAPTIPAPADPAPTEDVVPPAPPGDPRIAGVTAEQLHASWRPGCPVGPEDLRAVTVTHVDFAGTRRTGTLVVRADWAEAVLGVFDQLLALGFPIERIEPVDAYGGSDDASTGPVARTPGCTRRGR